MFRIQLLSMQTAVIKQAERKREREDKEGSRGKERRGECRRKRERKMD